MQAVVLVGGFGTRLRPLTATVPKPMLPVGHVPIIQRLIENLALAGVDRVVLALGFKPEPFLAAFPDGTCAGATLHYAVEPEPLDTAGAIRFAADHAAIDETFVVANGDILTDLDVASLVAFHRDRGALATIHLTPVDDPSAFGVVDADPTGKVRQFVEKPAPGEEPSNLINAGTYVLEPEVLAMIPLGRKVSIERETFPALVASGGLFAVATDDYWIDTGRPDLYLRANLDMLDGSRKLVSEGIAIGSDVDPTATIDRAVIAAGASVGPSAVVRSSVVLAGGRVGEGARVEDSVVMGAIGPGARIVRCVVGAEGVVADGAALDDERVPPPPA